MKQKIVVILSFFTLALMSSVVFAEGLSSNTDPPILVYGQVTMVEITRTGCFGCKIMGNTVPEIQAEYAGRAKVVIIDYKYDVEIARPFGPRVTPTHIFYNHKGEEVLRKTGSMNKAEIRKILDELLVAQAQDVQTVPIYSGATQKAK